MLRLIHLSDLHMHRDQHHPDNQNAFAIARHLRRRYSDAPGETHIVITGDCIDDGRAEQLMYFSSFLRALMERFTIHVCPGNHDYGPMGNYLDTDAIQRFRSAIGASEFPAFDAPETEDAVAFVGLDTADPEDSQWFAEGIVGKHQLCALRGALNGAPELGRKLVVLYMHHHPFYRVPGCTLADSQALLDAVSGRVGLVLFGHAHVSEAYFGKFGIPVMLASGKSTAPRGNALSYRIVLIENGQIEGVYTEEIKARVQEAA